VEVEEFLEKHQGKTDVEGRRQVVRNGYMPARQLVTGIGRAGCTKEDRKIFTVAGAEGSQEPETDQQG
jgi:hypothetical protein